MGHIDLANLTQEYWHMFLVGILLVSITINFLMRFVGQSRKLSLELTQSLAALTAIHSKIKGDVTELGEIGDMAMSGPALSRLWIEYRKTLHPQKKGDEHGQSQIVRWRATALAESFFTEQAIVDSRLETEFYKHVPGVLTGLGILGTFFGLIKGLNSFNVSLDATKVQEQLGNLVSSVGHAFYVSAAAIFLAMLFTWVEKSIVTSRCGQVEKLRKLIDSLFNGGAGEEYLERLVISSENAATQSAQIKDALVADLKEILTTLATQQMEAQARNVGQMSADVGRVIAESLGGPMDAITNVVKGLGTAQGDAVIKLLTDVLASFASQMREIFGGQMAGMSDLMVKASQSMQETAVQFERLAANMDAAGTNTVDAMGERLGKALEAMDARQGAMNAQMGAFVEQIKGLVSESQNESSQKLKDTLTAVGDQVAGVVEQLRRQAEQAAESQGERHARFEQTTGQAIGALSGQIEQLLAQSMETNKSLQNTVASLSQATDKAITGMNSGAETLLVAATDFAKAGQAVSETMRASSTAIEAIKTASTQLSTSTDGARAIIADYANTRDTFAVMIAELNSTFENAKRDASMTSEIIGRIETAAQHLAIAQKQSEQYLQGVSEVLVKAHEVFRDSIEATLREGNRKFQNELSGSVNMLSGAIKNLGDAVDDIPARR